MSGSWSRCVYVGAVGGGFDLGFMLFLFAGITSMWRRRPPWKAAGTSGFFSSESEDKNFHVNSQCVYN